MQRDRTFFSEHHFYGAVRLGLQKYLPSALTFEGKGTRAYPSLLQRRPWYWRYGGDLFSPHTYTTLTMSSFPIGIQSHLPGNRRYELCDHLGNVHAVVSDKRGTEASGAYKPALSAAYDYYPYGMLLPGRYAKDSSAGVGIVSMQQVAMGVQQSEAVGDLSVGWSYCGAVQVQSLGGGTVALFGPVWNSGCGAYGRPDFKGHLYRVFPAVAGAPMEVRLNGGSGGIVRLREQVGGVWRSISGVRVSTSGSDEVYSFTPASGSVMVGLEALGHGNADGTYGFEQIKLERLITTRWTVASVPVLVRSGGESKDNYRYGFNGQEKVNEIAGVGNHTTAPFWEYDTRLGRRWNLDPVDQISISNYAANRNNPIWFNDPLGNDPIGTVMKNGHQAGMPGSGTTADLNEVKIGAKKPQSVKDKENGVMNLAQAARLDIGRNDAGRAKADAAHQLIGGMFAIGAAPLVAAAAVETGAVGLAAQGARLLWSWSDVAIPQAGSYLFRARLASAMSDVLAQGSNKGVDNINIVQTGAAFFIGNPFVSTLPGSFINASTNSIYYRRTPVLPAVNSQTIKNIMLGTTGNMMGNAASGRIRGGMMEMGKKPNLFFETAGQQYGHQQATFLDEKTNK